MTRSKYDADAMDVKNDWCYGGYAATFRLIARMDDIARRLLKDALFKSRSDAAKRGWVTRRARQASR